MSLRADQGVTIIWVTQRCEGVAALAERLLLLRDGEVVESGDAQAVLRSPRSDFAAAFLSNAGLHLAERNSRKAAAQAVLRDE